MGWFINAVSFYVYGAERWFDYSWFADTNIRILGRDRQVRLVLEDRITADTSVCLQDRPFEDRLGNSCANYTALEWCNRHGEPSEDYCSTVPVNSPACDSNAFYYNGEDVNQAANNVFVYPNTECCQCGGGDRAPPEEFANSFGQTFQ